MYASKAAVRRPGAFACRPAGQPAAVQNHIVHAMNQCRELHGSRWAASWCVFWRFWSPILVLFDHLIIPVHGAPCYQSEWSESLILPMIFRMDSPLSFSLWLLCTIRPRMASARVASPIALYHWSMGNWLVISVDLRPVIWLCCSMIDDIHWHLHHNDEHLQGVNHGN